MYIFRKLIGIALVGFGFSFLVAACSGAEALSGTQETVQPGNLSQSETEGGLGFTPGDPELKATDPDTVSLASGQVQLIEFFAFW